MSYSFISSKFEQPKYVFLVLTALATVVCLGSSFLLGLHPEPSTLDADELQYYTMAGDLIRGNYEFNAQRTLGHVAILGLVRLITFDNFAATQIAMSLLSVLSAPLMYLLVRRHTGHNGLAIAVGLMVIFWGPFVYYNHTLYSESVALPLFICFLLLLPTGSLISNESESPWLRYGLAGSVLGLCMLVRPMYLLFVPFAIALIFLEEDGFGVSLKRAACLLIGSTLVVLPWSSYMTAQAGVPIILSANGGETISGGLNPIVIKNGYGQVVTLDGRKTWFGPGKWVPIHLNGYLSPEEQMLPYAKQDGLLKQRTFEWVISNPGSALYLQVAKLLYMWGIYPFWNGRAQTLFGNVPTVICVASSALALVRFRRCWRQLARFWLLPVFVSSVAMISWGSWRFREPGDLGLLTLCGLLCVSVVQSYRKNSALDIGSKTRGEQIIGIFR